MFSIKVVTDIGKLMEFDLNTIQLKDLEMQKCIYNIDLKKGRERRTVVQGLGTCFYVKFSTCFREVGFATTPSHHRTRWEQTVFFFSQSVSMLPVSPFT